MVVSQSLLLPRLWLTEGAKAVAAGALAAVKAAAMHTSE
jgi:hypothetical protein